MKNKATILLLLYIIATVVFSAGCGGKKAEMPNPYQEGKSVSLDGYKTMSDFSGDSYLVDTSVKEISKFMEEGRTFAFMATFEKCPFCNRAMPYVNKVLTERNLKIGYLDTRKDPSWQNNLDLEDYDLFAELFKDYLELDENNIPHLYVPDMYFIKDGKVVDNFTCSVKGGDDPAAPLTLEQEKELLDGLNAAFDKLQ